MGQRRPAQPLGLIHVTQRATDREVFFRDDLDYSAHLRLLVKTAKRYDAGIQDYCLMPNHLHLLLDLRHENLPELMQYLLARHVERFNRRHLRRGHLVQAPYRPKPI